MSETTLSILIPNYNHARFLPQAIESILSQSFQPKEIILLDDASTDNSMEVIERYAARSPLIRVRRNERNMGILHNLGVLVGAATGDYFFALAADDMVLPGFLEKSMAMLTRHPTAGICSSLSRVMDEKGVDKGVLPALMVSKEPVFLPPERARRFLGSFGNWMQGNATVYRRKALLDVGAFRPELYAFTDNFASQVLALKHGACFIPEPLSCWRRMPPTYSMRCHTDPEDSRHIVRNAMALMEGEFRDLFPRGYARNWEREVEFDQLKARFFAREGPGNDVTSAPRRPASLSNRLPVSLLKLYYIARYHPMMTIRRRIKMTLSSAFYRN
jgi:glycosyltransferase involved in cell wall biosynthesis